MGSLKCVPKSNVKNLMGRREYIFILYVKVVNLKVVAKVYIKL